jgi:transcriptional regulator with XRE-family HTH domain
MSFATTFTDLRARRRIPMRLFEERVGINPSYIHGVENDKLLPSLEKLELLASVFVEVAREQEAANPEEDARRLFRERERTAFMTAADRLDFDPDLAEVLISLRELDHDRRVDIVQPLKEAIALFSTLDGQERGAVKRLLPELMGFLESREGAERRNATILLAEAAEEALESSQDEDEPAPTEPAEAPEPSSLQSSP